MEVKYFQLLRALYFDDYQSIITSYVCNILKVFGEGEL